MQLGYKSLYSSYPNNNCYDVFVKHANIALEKCSMTKYIIGQLGQCVTFQLKISFLLNSFTNFGANQLQDLSGKVDEWH